MLDAGTRLGPYEIVTLLGSGGMGEVYRARDTRLGRHVAVKVLRSHLSADPAARSRFEREAKTISSLEHPNICALFDVGREGETEYLVMELLAGESLAHRIARGALPAAEVARIGAQIADALGHAHRAGVVHRDLKPGNVMLTRSGVKLVDFGLALLAMPGAGEEAAPDGETISAQATRSGMILGTVGYLSPEQVRGGRADPRSDLFALGAILFEMASGRRAFRGDSDVETLHAILNDDPPALPDLANTAPPALERVIRVCLAKDPEDRWQDARDLARELRWIAGDSGGAAVSAAAPSAGRGRRSRAPWVLAAAALLVAAASLLIPRREPGAPRVVSSIEPPPKCSASLRNGPSALSPDGRQIAFVATDSTGTASLWVRPLDRPEARELEATEGASSPFWSPDGRSLGYFAGGKLRRIDLESGTSRVLADAPWSAGGTWGRGGTILFAGYRGSLIVRVPANGGAAVPAVPLQKRGAFDWQSWPAWLPDGRHFLFASLTGLGGQGQANTIYVASLDPGEKPRPILAGVTYALPAVPGWLLFWREGSLWAQRFDESRLRTSGDPVEVADHVAFDTELSCGLASAAPTGALAYQQGGNTELSQLEWVDRSGRRLGTVAPAAYYYAPRLSHDGRTLAVTILDPVTGNGDIWTVDLERKIDTRITFDPKHEAAVVWSPRDDRIYWMSTVGARGPGDIHSRLVAGAGREETLFANDSLAVPLDCTPDGKTLVLMIGNSFVVGQMRSDLWLLSLPDRKAIPWLATSFVEKQARLSPDGRWLAWVCDETGQDEVYVQRFPEGGEKWRVSPAGGISPVWSPDGRELFYVSSTSELMSVSFSGSPTVAIGTPVVLFQSDLRPGRDLLEAEFDVSRDGRRFLVNNMVPATESSPITLDQNWSAQP